MGISVGLVVVGITVGDLEGAIVGDREILGRKVGFNVVGRLDFVGVEVGLEEGQVGFVVG